MYPMLQAGELVLVNPYIYNRAAPIPGDVVLAKHPYKPDLKIIKQVESVKSERCFLVGANPNLLETTDSRSFGTIAFQDIIGQVTSVIG